MAPVGGLCTLFVCSVLDQCGSCRSLSRSGQGPPRSTCRDCTLMRGNGRATEAMLGEDASQPRLRTHTQTKSLTGLADHSPVDGIRLERSRSESRLVREASPRLLPLDRDDRRLLMTGTQSGHSAADAGRHGRASETSSTLPPG